MYLNPLPSEAYTPQDRPGQRQLASNPDGSSQTNNHNDNNHAQPGEQQAQREQQQSPADPQSAAAAPVVKVDETPKVDFKPPARENVRPDRCFVPKGTDLCAPYFFVIGAFKAGTTSMYNYLARHPGPSISLLFSLQS